MSRIGDKEYRALKPDAQGFDLVQIMTIPRFKESGLSGSEWRICAEINVYRKNTLILNQSYRDVETAAKFLPVVLATAHDSGEACFAGEGNMCDQEGCCARGIHKLYKRANYCREGHASPIMGIPSYRLFCNNHKDRGNQSFDDCNRNYSPTPIFTPYEVRQESGQCCGDSVVGD